MDKSKFSAALAIMAGLVFLGAMLPVSVSKISSGNRTVSVKGLCEREVDADKVIWPLKFKVVGNDLELVSREIDAKNAAIRKFLLDGGISEDDFSVSLPDISDKYAQEYGSNDRAFRFVAASTMTVCTKDVSKVLGLFRKQDSLFKQGIMLVNDWETRASFYFEGLNDIKPEMIEEATKNAREVALKFASDSQSKLGKIKHANQGTFSIESRDENTPHIKKVRVVTNVEYFLSR